MFGYISDMNYLMGQKDNMDYRQFDTKTGFCSTQFIAGVNVKAGNKEKALDFISFLLSKEGQTASQMFDEQQMDLGRLPN